MRWSSFVLCRYWRRMGREVQFNVKALCILTAIVIFFRLWFSKEETMGSSGYSFTVMGGESGVRKQISKHLQDDLPHRLESFLDLNPEKINFTEDSENIRGVDVFYRRCNASALAGERPSGKTVLLLHDGDKFGSDAWFATSRTMHVICAAGHAAVAIDLPGHAKTRDKWSGPTSALLNSAILQLCPGGGAGRGRGGPRTVVVAPGAADSVARELLLKRPDQFCGLVSLDGHGSFSAEAAAQQSLDQAKVPSLVVSGKAEEDNPNIKDGYARFDRDKWYPGKPDPRRPFFLEQPQIWSRLIFNYVKMLKCGQT